MGSLGPWMEVGRPQGNRKLQNLRTPSNEERGENRARNMHTNELLTGVSNNEI